jgi:hypothetical protein
MYCPDDVKYGELSEPDTKPCAVEHNSGLEALLPGQPLKAAQMDTTLLPHGNSNLTDWQCPFIKLADKLL